MNFDDYGLIDLAFNTQSGTLIRAMDFLEGEDRDYTTMNTPELQAVVRHFEQFGNGYATSLLTAVPEPSTIALLVPIGALLARRPRKSYAARISALFLSPPSRIGEARRALLTVKISPVCADDRFELP